MQDSKWPSVSFTRLGVLIGTPLAVVLSIHGAAWAAATLKTWNTGDVLTADDLNTNMAALNDAMVDKTTDQTIAGAKEFTGDVKVDGALKVGFQSYFGGPGSIATGCARPSDLPNGVFDCTCPAGMVVINGGVNTASGTTKLLESRPVAGNKWRFACLDTNNGALDCPYYTYSCARLSGD